MSLPQIKRCTVCHEVKVLTDFSRHPTSRDRRQSSCKACQSAAAPRRRHGMSPAEKAAAAALQGGCAICKTSTPGSHGWVVDHDHLCCGPVRSCSNCRRAVLCQRCNTALGMARDDPQLLRVMADYLELHALRRAPEAEMRAGVRNGSPAPEIQTYGQGRTNGDSELS